MPGVQDCVANCDVESPLLGAEDASRFRGLTVHANYVSLDRADAQFAIKELHRDMSAPIEQSWRRLVQLTTCSIGEPRVVIEFSWSAEIKHVDILSDVNWAGCHKSRKSTSGINPRSKTQGTIAQSSAGSELLAAVRSAVEGIELISLGRDLGLDFLVRIVDDASAALGIIEPRGIGHVRHLDVASFWMQEQKLRTTVEMLKVPGLKSCRPYDRILCEGAY